MKRFLLLAALTFITLTAEAQLVRSSALTVIREELPPVELGWKHIVNGQVGVDIFNAEPIVGVHYIAAYRFTDSYLAGVGVGVEYLGYSIMDGDFSVPLYLHGRYYFATNRWSPYVGASAGFYLKSEISFVDINFGFNHRLGTDAKNELSIYAGLKSVGIALDGYFEPIVMPYLGMSFTF